MKKLSALFISGLCLAVGQFSVAASMSSIYTADVVVSSQKEPEKTAAIQQGLKIVLIKVSGNPQITSKKLPDLLQLAANLMEENSYTAAPTKNQFIMHIRFDAEGVDKALKELDLPVWGQNRPLIIGWLVDETPTHTSEIVDSAATTPTNKVLEQAAHDAGLPFILPIMDMEDLSKVTLADITDAHVPVLQAAAKRYGSSALLVGHIKTVDKAITIQWRLIWDTDQLSGAATGNTLAAAAAQLFEALSQKMSERLAVSPKEASQDPIQLDISNIKQQSDLLHITRFLQTTSTVSDIQLVNVEGSDITLTVRLRVSKEDFLKAIAQSDYLELLPPKIEDPDTVLFRLNH